MVILHLVYHAATPRSLTYKLVPQIYEKGAIKSCSVDGGGGKVVLHEKGVDAIYSE